METSSGNPVQPAGLAEHDPYHVAVGRYRAGDLEGARGLVQALLAEQPQHLAALNLAAVVAAGTHRWAEAEAAYRRALEIRPDFAEVHSNLGALLRQNGRPGEAEAAYRRALELQPGYADAWNNLGILLLNAGRQADALDCFERTLALRPEYPYAAGNVAFCRAMLCQWDRHDEIARLLADGVARDEPCTMPFVLLGLADDPAMQLRCARTYVRHRLPGRPAAIAPRRHGRIRVAYVSPDFRNHPVAYLVADLIERHDRYRFEVIGVSLGPRASDEWRQRLERGFDRFLDVHGRSDQEVARELRALEVDIAVDLAGHTSGSRPALLALRPAPIQVSYLGYPGTMGAPFIDYLLADPFVVPRAEAACYAEGIVRLPECFQCGAIRRIAPQTPCRQDLGLPEQGFVFCCFNNSYKLQPPVFEVWMRLLQRVEGSVLWLYRPDEQAQESLRRQAGARGVDPARLVFGSRLAPEDYLARYRRADLFLDTLPYNGGTTVGDALWAGLPVLTCAGRAFAARMAGSLLRSAGLPELVTGSLPQYEALALRLATRPGELAALRSRLQANRQTWPLFDVDRFRRHLEAAYLRMWETWQRGEPPAAFDVEPLDPGGGAPVTDSVSATTPTATPRRVLHVGCGHAPRERMPRFFQSAQWQEVRLDIDPACKPDIVASMVAMDPVAAGSVTAIYSSHNLEHLYPHEVPQALAEFHRVLAPEGFAVVTLPDLQGVAELVARDRLEDTAYESPAGPIAPLDILYGHRASLARGNLFMAHRTGFTARTLARALRDAGFSVVTVQRDGRLNLWAIAFKQPPGAERLAEMQKALFPRPVKA